MKGQSGHGFTTQTLKRYNKKPAKIQELCYIFTVANIGTSTSALQSVPRSELFARSQAENRAHPSKRLRNSFVIWFCFPPISQCKGSAPSLSLCSCSGPSKQPIQKPQAPSPHAQAPNSWNVKTGKKLSEN